MSAYKLKVGKIGKKIILGYQKIESTVVRVYKKIEGKFIDAFLEKKD